MWKLFLKPFINSLKEFCGSFFFSFLLFFGGGAEMDAEFDGTSSSRD